ncbi:transcriptional regulator [Actinocorallia longicatena]|uniref:DUF3307 domain-containing protein n=1 Tax=Actinocorallia longicatena TaxID=111803 RepID=A0ABP6QEY7_9ACTN
MKLADPAVFATCFAALYAAHHVGDHWLQTHHQAITKGRTDRDGALACLRHVLTLTALKGAALALAIAVTGIRFPLYGLFLAVALLIDAASHAWADRRITLLALADRIGKGEFARLGDVMAAPAGTGAYALDQSWHIGWLFLTALIAALGATS